MVTYWNRLKPLMAKKGIAKQALADAIGVSFQAIAKVENGGALGSRNNIKAAEFFGVSSEWLATGKGNMKTAGGDYEVHPTDSVPILTWVQAKHWQQSIDALPAHSPRCLVTCKVSPYTYALIIEDDSNTPFFPLGSEIIVEPDEIPVNQKWVIMDDGGEQTSLKRLVISGSHKYLTCDNTRYPVRDLKKTDTFCGVVKQLIQNI